MIEAREASNRYLTTYRAYARMATRRRAAPVRQAQTVFDRVSRELGEAEEQHTRAQAELVQARETLEALRGSGRASTPGAMRSRTIPRRAARGSCDGPPWRPIRRAVGSPRHRPRSSVWSSASPRFATGSPRKSVSRSRSAAMRCSRRSIAACVSECRRLASWPPRRPVAAPRAARVGVVAQRLSARVEPQPVRAQLRARLLSCSSAAWAARVAPRLRPTRG